MAKLREVNVTLHFAQKRHPAIDGRTTRHSGHQTSQRIRKRVKEGFGWIKAIGGRAKTAFTFAAAVYNLIRIPKLIAAEASS